MAKSKGKVLGFEKIFTYNSTTGIYDISTITGTTELNNKSIIFITVTTADKGRKVVMDNGNIISLSSGDTFIWSQGKLYIGNSLNTNGLTYDPVNNSIARGVSTATGEGSYSEGYHTKASGDNAHAEGCSFDENSKTAITVTGIWGDDVSIQVIYYDNTTPITNKNTIEFIFNGVKYISHIDSIVGDAINTIIPTPCDESKPYDTTAYVYNIIGGAEGDNSHTEGFGTTATGDNAHAEGNGTIASGNDQHVQGRFNTADSTKAFIIGKGTDDGVRSNAFTVDWNGNVNASGGFFQTSDARRKNVGGELDLEKAYGLIDKCSAIIYTLKDNTDKKEIGLIAQEVQEFFPEIVGEDSEGFLTLDYARITVILLRVMKDLIDKVERLRRNVAPIVSMHTPLM